MHLNASLNPLAYGINRYLSSFQEKLMGKKDFADPKETDILL